MEERARNGIVTSNSVMTPARVQYSLGLVYSHKAISSRRDTRMTYRTSRTVSNKASVSNIIVYLLSS